ncbi:MAG TPA: polysaccharide deacetylase family protein [Candidatus Cryosericum sp.]|nr:polysaccharide deacetylase family protein [Candidatus Cryosericum sp.]
MADRGPRRTPRAALVRASMALHAGGAVLGVVLPRTWPWVFAGLVADHLLLVGGSLWPRSSLVGPNLTRLPAGVPDDRSVALTFDDGPDPAVTPRVLEILGRRGALATFFFIGRRAEAYPDLVAETARRGHRVENHSHRHLSGFCFLGPRAIGREIDRAQDVLSRCAGEAPRWFRAPAGIRNPWLDGALVRRGLELASWTRRGLDTVSRDPARVLRRLTRSMAPGDVLALHDGSAARDRDGRPVVVETLPRLLDAIDAAGLRAVPLPAPPGPHAGA